MDESEVVLDVVVPVAVSVAVTVYVRMLLPPLLAGAVHVTVADVLLAATVPETPVGAPGVVYGVTELVEEDAVPVPSLLTAATVKVYATL